jgi:hypothetical protein
MSPSAPIPPGPERTALKEWAVLVDAMARGDIVAMVRKGGIREQRKGFSVRHDRFLLYPTYFHEKAAELAERFRETLGAAHERRPPEGTVRLEYVCDVVGVWAVADLSRLDGAAAEHGLAPAAVASRFHYKDRPGVQVVAVRTRRLPHSVDVPEIRRYAGCVSWVELDHDVDVAGAAPVLTDPALRRRVAALSDVLGQPIAGEGVNGADDAARAAG